MPNAIGIPFIARSGDDFRLYHSIALLIVDPGRRSAKFTSMIDVDG